MGGSAICGAFGCRTVVVNLGDKTEQKLRLKHAHPAYAQAPLAEVFINHAVGTGADYTLAPYGKVVLGE